MTGCDEVREILVAVARAETVSATGQRLLREHVEDCAECRRRLANQRMLSAGLASIAGEAGQPSPQLRSALMAEFRRERKVVPMRRVSAKWIAVATAAAAAVLIAVFFAASLRKAPEIVAPPVLPVAKAPVAPPAPAPVSVTPKPMPAAARAHVPVPPRPRRKAAPQPAPAEVATDFFEIPYVEPLRPDQRADVFRVQVPRASMAAFGLPVTGGHLDSHVTADVLMGEDGVVRAVRFIR